MSFVKKTNNSLVINTDIGELSKYREQKYRVKKEKHLEEELSFLKFEVAILRAEIEKLKNR